jgi:hypothetical protein
VIVQLPVASTLKVRGVKKSTDTIDGFQDNLDGTSTSITPWGAKKIRTVEY